jgi:uncharacterized NAD(P)/FAD-binding protein YdhS
MTRPLTIGVVGGGAAAVCLLDAIEQTGGGPGEITVFEPAAAPWRGRPYQADVPAVRVNIPPEGMSVRQGDSGHFARWLAAGPGAAGPGNPHHDPWCDATFVPRAVFGDYLADAARGALDRLRSRGWRVELVAEAVDRAIPRGEGVVLGTGHGRRVPVRYAVLCVGAGRPADSYFLTGAGGFVPEPYPLARRLAGLDPDAEVGVVGSGLTGVDVVLALAARGHRGRIHLLSRSGALPAVRQRVVPYTMRHFTADRFRAAAARGESVTLSELAAVMRAELAGAGADPGTLAAEIAAVGREDPLRRLARQLAEVDAPDLGLRILQRAVPATGPDVWPLLPFAQQAEALRRHYRTVMSLCCPMPPSSARRLTALIGSGQLEIVPGVRHVAPLTRGGFGVVTDDGERRTDAVVNAVDAPAHRIPAAAEPLTASLIEAGITVRHPLGGVRVERATSGLSTGAAVDTRVYALGHLAAGSLFFTFGMPSIVDRAYDIARAVVADASADRSARLRDAVSTA